MRPSWIYLQSNPHARTANRTPICRVKVDVPTINRYELISFVQKPIYNAIDSVHRDRFYWLVTHELYRTICLPNYMTAKFAIVDCKHLSFAQTLSTASSTWCIRTFAPFNTCTTVRTAKFVTVNVNHVTEPVGFAPTQFL